MRGWVATSPCCHHLTHAWNPPFRQSKGFPLPVAGGAFLRNATMLLGALFPGIVCWITLSARLGSVLASPLEPGFGTLTKRTLQNTCGFPDAAAPPPLPVRRCAH